ncbi:MAG: glycosyltransferase family 2 protein [Chloroflexota bacterium]
MRWLYRVFTVLCLMQAALAVRVLARLLKRGAGPIRRPLLRDATGQLASSVSVIVPVLNEVNRLGPCLDGLTAQDNTVGEILVVDGGSADGTQQLVRQYVQRDARIHLVDASPMPPDWNGKSWGLQVGLERAAPEPFWILTVDADVRLRRGLVSGLVERASDDGVSTASVATAQEIAGPALGLLHPSCLATLVYRLGAPGRIVGRPAGVQANGQCQLFRRAALTDIDGFTGVRASRCEDVTIARALVADGGLAAFYETDDLVSARMYESWREAWNGWTRSLPLRDRYCRWTSLLGLAEVTLVQAAPLPAALLLAASSWRSWPSRALLALNVLLVLVRLGILTGMRRAYPDRPWTYWLSPIADIPVTVQLWASILKRRHTWRGRPLVVEGDR